MITRGRVRQTTHLFQKPRTAYRHIKLVGQLLDQQFGIIDLYCSHVPDRDVDAVSSEVGIGECRRNPRVDAGVGRQETIKARCQPLGGEARRCADDEDAVVAAGADTGQRLPDLAEASLQAGIKLAADIGQGDGARSAMEQLEPEKILKTADLMTEGARRDAQFRRCFRQAQMAGSRLESAQRG